MKFKYIVSTGCSYIKRSFEETEGRRESDGPSNSWRDATSFTQIMGEELGIPVWNVAVEGSCAKYLTYRLYRWLEDNPKKIKDTFFVIGITHFGRDTLWMNHNEILHGRHKEPGIKKTLARPFVMPRVYKSTREGMLVDEVDDLAPQTGHTSEQLYNFLEMYWRDFIDFNELEIMQTMHYKMLHSYLNELGGEHVFLNIFNEKAPKSLPYYTFPDGNQQWKRYITGKDKQYQLEHPNAVDHREMAHFLIDYINERYGE